MTWPDLVWNQNLQLLTLLRFHIQLTWLGQSDSVVAVGAGYQKMMYGLFPYPSLSSPYSHQPSITNTTASQSGVQNLVNVLMDALQTYQGQNTPSSSNITVHLTNISQDNWVSYRCHWTRWCCTLQSRAPYISIPSQSFIEDFSDLYFYEFTYAAGHHTYMRRISTRTLLFSRVLKHLLLFVQLFILVWNADALLFYPVIICQ